MSQKISQLPAVFAANIQDTDILPIVATNVTSKVTVANLRTKLGTQPPLGGRTVTDSFTYLTNNAVFNVKDFGAFGDGVTDDTIAVQAALTAASVAGGVVLFPAGKSFKITNELTVYSNTVVHAEGSTITQVTADKCAIRGVANASNVAMYGGKWVGPGQTSYTDPAKGVIYFVSTVGYSSDIRIEDCDVSQGPNGISAIQVDRLWINRNYIHDLGATSTLAAGIIATKSRAFVITANRILAVAVTLPFNSYGITATGDLAGGLEQQQCVIANNLIDGIPSWDGIMSHDVSDLIVSGNVMKNVRTGVDIGSGTNVNVIRRVIVIGNTILCTSTNTYGATAAAHGGIAIQGYDATHRIGVVVVAYNVISNVGALAGATYTSSSGGVVLGYIDNATCIGNFMDGMLATTVGLNAINLQGTLNRITVALNSVQGAFGSGIRAAAITCDYLNINGNVFAPTNTATMPGVLITGGTITQLVQYGNLDPSTTAAGASHGGAPTFAPVFGLTDAATVAIDASRGNAFSVTLAGNRAMGAPTNPVNGQRATFTIVQDGTGGRTLTWNAVFKVSWSDAGNTLNKRSSISFIYDGAAWNQDGAQTPYV